MEKLKNIDTELLIELSKLPKNFWDFKGENVKESIHGIHTYPAVMIHPIRS